MRPTCFPWHLALLLLAACTTDFSPRAESGDGSPGSGPDGGEGGADGSVDGATGNDACAGPCDDDSHCDEASGDCVCDDTFMRSGDACVPMPCGGPCGANSTCNEASNECVCDPDYMASASGCVAVPCGDSCGSNASCNTSSNICECDDEYVRIDGECVGDPCLAKFGGPSCGTNEYCALSSEGVASCECNSGTQRCGGACVDLDDDPDHCGSCDYACAGSLACSGGTCEQAVHELVLGEDATCALMETVTPSAGYPVRCWGRGDDWLFRGGSQADSDEPRAITGVSHARAMSVDRERQCVLLPSSDTVRCWGHCGISCGAVTTADSESFRDITVAGATALAGMRGAGVFGGTDTGGQCALRGTGGVRCWGYAPLVPDTDDQTMPQSLSVDGNVFVNFTQLVTGMTHGCALATDKRVVCWGDNGANQLGNDPPAQPGGVYVELANGSELTDVRHLAANIQTTCAARTDGKVYCWGSNGAYLLGQGTNTSLSGAYQIPGLSDIESVAVGGSAACALDASHQVYCWGYKTHMGIGDGAIGDVSNGNYFSTPQTISTLDDVIEIKMGINHACARRLSGEVVCWGVNDDGAVGDGTTVLRPEPTPVKDLIP